MNPPRKINLKHFIENSKLVRLPSSLWGLHTDTHNKFLAFTMFEIKGTTKTTKSVVLSETLEIPLKIEILMNNQVVEIPYISININNVQELNYLLNAVNDVKFCKYHMRHDGCLIYSLPFVDLCNWCEKKARTTLKFDQNHLCACSFCDERLESVELLNVHEGNHLPSIDTCTICLTKLTSIENLLMHYASKHSAVTFIKCLSCTKRYTNIKDLKVHARSHIKLDKRKQEVLKKNVNHLCTTCNKKFATGKLLKQHVKEHVWIELMCKHCGRGFEELETFNIHKNICYARPKFKCERCNCKFSCISQKMSHIAKNASS